MTIRKLVGAALILAATVLPIPAASSGDSCHGAGLAATCKGEDPCNACKNCKSCKHCKKDGGTCGVCEKP